MDINVWKELSCDKQKELLTRPAENDSSKIEEICVDIINNVKEKGDEALFFYSEKFDKDKIEHIFLTKDEIKNAVKRVPSDLKKAIDKAYENIYNFHKAQESVNLKKEDHEGIICECHEHAIEKVGLYVPGGSAPLVSTALMLSIPAKIAKCNEVVLATPAPVADAIVYAAKKAGVSKIMQVGGAQAIAAMAYGTQSIPKVYKIFGPGNQFVTMAKKIVSSDPKGAQIDMGAGPSEVLVIADNEASEKFIASDLLSQAEHGPDSQVLLLTTSKELCEKVLKEIDNQLQVLSRAEIAKKALAKSHAIVLDSLKECVLLSNEYAPEHLIVHTKKPRSLLPLIKNAGSIFLGAYTPESLGDYASGTNHTLPTYGYAKTQSALGTADFRRRFTVSYASKKALKKISKTVIRLADEEGLSAHANAVKIRIENLNKD